MFCFRYKRLLIPYNEGVLGEAERAGVEAHLSRCAGCRSELEAVRSVSGALRAADVPAMEPATDLWAKVSARIETEAARPAPRPWLKVSQAASACAAALLLAVVGIGMFGPDAPAPAPQNAPAVELRPEEPAPRARVPLTEKPKPVEERATETRSVPLKPPAPGTRPSAPAETVGRITVPPPPPPPAPERFAAVRGIEAKPAPELSPVTAGRENRESRSYTPSVGYARGDGRTNWHLDDARKGVAVAPSRAAGRPKGEVSGISEEKVAGADVDYAWDDKDGDSKARANHFYADGATAPTNKPATRFGTELTGRLARSSSAAAPAAAPAPSCGLAFGTHTTPTCGDTPTLTAEMDARSAESVVDTLNETEGVHVVALFAYP